MTHFDNAAQEPVPSAELSKAALAELLVHEAAITKSLHSFFIEVGTELGAIRDGRLYLQTHRSFEAYTKRRWNLDRRRADQLIAAAAVGTIVPSISNEAQARELVPLLDDPDRMREVVAQAEASGKVTADSLRRARDTEPRPSYAEVRAEWEAIKAEGMPAVTVVGRKRTWQDNADECRLRDDYRRRVWTIFARLVDVAPPLTADDYLDPEFRAEMSTVCRGIIADRDDRPVMLGLLAYLDHHGTVDVDELWANERDEAYLSDDTGERRRELSALAAYEAKLYTALAGGAE